MANMTKEEVIAALQAALEKVEGRSVQIEQKGSWYKIDDGKSMRFGELEALLTTVSQNNIQSEARSLAKSSNLTARKPLKSPKTLDTSSGGLLPKDLWKQQLQAKGKNTLPRGIK